MQRGDLGRIHVEPDYRKARAMKRGHQRQSNVTQADDPDQRGLIFNLGLECHRLSQL